MDVLLRNLIECLWIQIVFKKNYMLSLGPKPMYKLWSKKD
jgi:hypothetical protein